MNISASETPGHFCLQCPTVNHCVASKLRSSELENLSQVMKFGRRIQAGEHLFVAGDDAQHQYHVRSGMLKSYFLTCDGDEFVTGFYLPGEVIPNSVDKGKHTHSVQALDESSICAVITGQDEGTLADTGSPAVWQAINLYSHAMTSQALTHQINLKSTSAQARFAGFCVDLMNRLENLKRDPLYLATPMSRTDIASYLGVTLESLSRVVSRMKRNGVVRANRECIEILQPDILRSLASHMS